LRPVIKRFKKVLPKFGVLAGCCLFLFTVNADAFEISGAEVTPSVSVSESYDDNVSFASHDTQSDFITRISPAVNASYDAKDFKWDMYADITQEMFSQYSKFDNTSENLRFNAAAELSKHDRISLSEKFSHTYEPANFDQAFARTLGRYSYYTNDITVEYIRDLTRQMSIHTSYANELDLVSAEGMSDSVLNKLAVQLDYVFSASAACSTAVTIGRRDFDPGTHAEQLRWDAAVKYNFSRLTSVKFTAGLDDFITRPKDYVRPVFILAFEHEAGKKAEASITLKKQYELNSYSQELFDCWRASTFLNYRFTRKITAGAGLYYGEGTYVQSRIDETFIGSEAMFRYEPAKDTKIDCTYAYTQNTSNDAGREYTRNIFSLGVKREF